MVEQSRQFVMIHDLIEKNGKTIKENNLARQHSIPVGALVEIVRDDGESPDDPDYLGGVRLHVAKHTRDCDGTPLYTLSPYRNPRRDIDGDIWEKSMANIMTGFPVGALRVVRTYDYDED